MADPTDAQRQALASQGKAMPGGGFYIRNRADLDNAIRAVGRVRPNTEEARSKVRRFIQRRGAALGATDAIPATWNRDGTLSGN